MLTSQGWKPGDTLGAEGASHASHYTAASASHIRVMLRDDNLGLGAKNGRQDTDAFGLDMFQGLLGRLNGKSEDALAKEAGFRRDLRLKEKVMKKFGGTTFVSGGYLVGDKIENTAGDSEEPKDFKELIAVKEKNSKPKKRKRGEAEETVEIVAAGKKSKTVTFADDVISKKDKKKNKKDKKRKVETASGESTEEETAQSTAEETIPTNLSEKEAKQLRKAEKKARKEARHLKREDRKKNKRKDERPEKAEASDSSAPDEVAPSILVRTPAVARGRFHVRQRYLQQKRMAIGDAQAMKEIFMIKAAT